LKIRSTKYLQGELSPPSSKHFKVKLLWRREAHPKGLCPLDEAPDTGIKGNNVLSRYMTGAEKGV
jgi:hypothetical protein